jgi:hypothetical protein
MNNSQTANVSEHGSPFEISNITAYHLAGHAVAICIGNKRKQLPAVHFQIIKEPQNQENSKPMDLPVCRANAVQKLKAVA